MVRKSAILAISCFIFLVVSAVGQGTIAPDLQKAIDGDRDGRHPVVVILKEQFGVAEIQNSYALAGVREEVRQRICEILQEKTAISQHWLRSYLSSERDQVRNPQYFWIVNAVSLEANARVIRELALRAEIASIQLDAEQVMVRPIQGTRSQAWGVNYIKAPKAWDKGIKGDGIVVAVVDTGIDLDHPGFAPGQILVNDSKSFVEDEPSPDDGHGHGTHCAGTVGSPDYGVAPGVKMIAVRVLDSSGSGTWTSVANGVQYAVQHARVISMSLGGEASFDKNIAELAVEQAVDMGVVCSIAAGNEGWGINKICSPGLSPKVITVGAVYKNGGLTSFSSQGPTIRGDAKPDIVAPGADVPSLWKDGDTNTISGTSMATPHVAGLAALVLSKNGDLTPQQVKDIIANPNNTFGTKTKNSYGNGIVDADKCTN